MPIRVIQICDYCGAENAVELDSEVWFEYDEGFVDKVVEAMNDEDWWRTDCKIVCSVCWEKIRRPSNNCWVWRWGRWVRWGPKMCMESSELNPAEVQVGVVAGGSC